MSCQKALFDYHYTYTFYVNQRPISTNLKLYTLLHFAKLYNLNSAISETYITERTISFKRIIAFFLGDSELALSLLINKQAGGKKKREGKWGGVRDLWTTHSRNEAQHSPTQV